MGIRGPILLSFAGQNCDYSWAMLGPNYHPAFCHYWASHCCSFRAFTGQINAIVGPVLDLLSNPTWNTTRSAAPGRVYALSPCRE